MSEKAKKIILEMNVKGIMDGTTKWVVKEDCEDHSNDSTSIGLNSEDFSMNSECSCSSELTEDASSSTSSSSTHTNGPLYELTDLMNHLPIKRGLSIFYEGKAQSFTSLDRVQSIEDLPKKGTSYSERMKSCRSYGGGLDSQRISHAPKAIISKKTSRGSFASVLNKRGSFLRGSRPSIALHKKF